MLFQGDVRQPVPGGPSSVAMARRRFLQLSATAALAPLSAGSFALTGNSRALAERRGYFDERFPVARTLAAALAGPVPLTAVRGDITGPWRDGLGACCRQTVTELCGVTTESFHFCLEQLAREVAATALQTLRVDRDLIAWRLSTRPTASTGTNIT
jgi:hypothetical protein